MSVEAPERLTTSSYPKYEVVINPDVGGRVEPPSSLKDYIYVYYPPQLPVGRILPLEAPQRIEISPRLPKNSPLEQAGFLLYRQMENFIAGVNQGAVVSPAEELLANMRSHTNEYPLRRPLLEGKVRLTPRGIVNSYNDELIRNHLDFTEREGATAYGFLDLETKALTGQDGNLIIQISPMGWNGVYPNYENTQIVIYKLKDKKNGEVEQLTFVLKGYFLEDCINLLCALGVDRQTLVGKTEKDSIKNIVGQAHFLPAGVKSAEDLLKIVKAQSTNPKNPVFAAIEKYLDLLDQGIDISRLPPACEQMLNKVTDFIRENAQKFADFALQLGLSDLVEETLYKIAEYVLGYSQKKPSKEMTNWINSSVYGAISNFSSNPDWRDEYQGVIHKLQQIGGCAGGGSSSRGLSGFSLGQIRTEGTSFIAESDQYGSLEFECHQCKVSLRRPKGGRLPSCYNCGVKFAC